MSETFTCAQCHESFSKAWTDEEAIAEAVDLFEETLMDGVEVVCEDCWKAMNDLYPPAEFVRDWRA